jgi:hypothetical protein
MLDGWSQIIKRNGVESTVKEVVLASMVGRGGGLTGLAMQRGDGEALHSPAAACICPPVATQCMVRSNHQK